MRIYRDVVRPFAARGPPLPHEKVFLTALGVEDPRLGRKVTQFFEAEGLHISSTTIRAIVETRADNLFAKDLISVSYFNHVILFVLKLLLSYVYIT